MRIEGLDDARWVLMDYGDFLVHVFVDEAREYYDLEHLWAGRAAHRLVGNRVGSSPVGKRRAGLGGAGHGVTGACGRYCALVTGVETRAPSGAVGTSMGSPAISISTLLTPGCPVAV